MSVTSASLVRYKIPKCPVVYPVNMLQAVPHFPGNLFPFHPPYIPEHNYFFLRAFQLPHGIQHTPAYIITFLHPAFQFFFTGPCRM